MSKITEAELVTITKGMAQQIKANKSCPGCNLPIPKYPGRYPKYCPNCGIKLEFNITDNNIDNNLQKEDPVDIDTITPVSDISIFQSLPKSQQLINLISSEPINSFGSDGILDNV